MNGKMVINTLGRIMLVEAALLMLPTLVAVLYAESCVWALLIAAGVALLLGLPATLACRPKNKVIYAKEGFLIVSVAWILMSLVGALPFFLSGEIPSFIDAFFETVSGFTTTGASILTDVEAMSKGLLFWRSFTHWVGGMGVLVFVVAIVPNTSGRPIHMLRAEMPGPTMGKLVPRLRDTAKILYLIYIVMTVVEIIMLLCGGMSLFDSLLHSFGTAGTGGFGIKADGLSSYSPYCQWVIAIFMLLFGVNFNLYYFMLIRRFKAAFKNTELWVYGGIVLVSVVLIAVNIYHLCGNVEETLRTSVFQVSSIITTTGYATTDFNLWPDFSKGILLVLMLIGGCAGSTAGGLKVSRAVILCKTFRREWKRLLHPRSVNTVKLDGKQVEDSVISGVSSYFALYILCMVVIFILLSLEPFGLETNLSATVSCFNNIGPAFGAAGPMGGYAGYNAFSTGLLSVAMLLGRLEIFPILLSFSPAMWKKH